MTGDFQFCNFSFSLCSLFKSLVMYESADLYNLLVFYWTSLNLFMFLSFISVFKMFSLNMSLVFLFFKHLFANLAVKISLLSFSVGMFNIVRPYLYECFPSRIILTATLWTLSRAVVFCLVRLACQTTDDCSTTMLTYVL